MCVHFSDLPTAGAQIQPKPTLYFMTEILVVYLNKVNYLKKLSNPHIVHNTETSTHSS